MTIRRLAALSTAALALSAHPAAAREPEVFGSGIVQPAMVYTTDPADKAQRWLLRGGYAATGEIEGTTESGLRFGASATIGSGDYERSLDRPGSNATLTVNEAYLWLVSAWGGVRIGDEDGAVKRAADLMPLIGGGQFDGYWTKVASPFTDHLGRTSDDATKIIYETPRLFGLRLGASYAPERKSLVEDIRKESFIPAEEDLWEVGLNYRGDAGPWSYELAAGYLAGEGGAPGVDDTRGVTLAALVLYGGFSAGAVWFSNEVGLPAGAAGSPTGTDVDGLTLQGVYENGPYGATLWWQMQQADGIAAFDAYGLGLSWRATPDVTLGLDVIRYADQPAGPDNNDNGWVGQVSATGRF